MTDTAHPRLCLAAAADWKEAVITLLDAGAPYWPWQLIAGDPRPGDRAILVLRTDPVSVISELAPIEAHTDITGAPMRAPRFLAGAAELATVASALGLSEDYATWDLDALDAERISQVLEENSGLPRVFSNTVGHSSLSAARILLDFNGNCTGCGEPIDLSVDDARDQVHVHTIGPSSEDWSAVVCAVCRDRMREEKVHSLVDFKFAQHPDCPSCGGQRTRVIRYGMPPGPDCWGPWVRVGGCCVTPENKTWECELCDHQW